MYCLVCGTGFEAGKRLSDHIKRHHGLTSEEYTVRHVYGGTRPGCKECGTETRYVSFTYMPYCKAHARLAMSRGGREGGKAPAWNRGGTKETDARIAALAERQKGESNAFFGKNHTPETRAHISQSKTLTTQELMQRVIERGDMELVTNPAEYWSRQQQYLTFRCIECGTEQDKTLQTFERGSLCRKCHPLGQSKWELEVAEFVAFLVGEENVVIKDRTVIGPKELDIYVPSHGFAIECHGLYWHSRPDVDPNAHELKADLCDRANVRLLQLFEDEWANRPDVCMSLIAARLGKCVHVGARKLDVIELPTDRQKAWFDRCHLAGYTPARKCFALAYADSPYAALSLRVPRQAKYKGAVEVARFATEHYTAVQGGLSRLMKRARAWAKAEGFDRVVTYVDRRVGQGRGYEACGFERIGQTGRDYWYTDGWCRHDRFRFRAQDGVPERVIAEQAGVSRIYGAGSWVMSSAV